MGRSEYEALFETKDAKGRSAYRLFSCSILVGICWILCYRVLYVSDDRHENKESGRWVARWLMFAAELMFSIYWVFTLSLRWNRVHRYTFKHILSHRSEEKLPGVDVFVCTADPTIEPPMMVINTVLSITAYNYPPEKLSVYLSDDGGSDLTFYVLLEASHFSKHWIPFCKKFNVEPRSPAAYFSIISSVPHEISKSQEFLSIKNLYDEMEHRIETATKLGRISKEIRAQHKGFSEWDTVQSPCDHQTILQILIDGRDPNDVDSEGFPLPSLVYLSREKRPKHAHNFKAGAMNALVEFPGMDGYGGPAYIGTGCFHRRETLCGKKYVKGQEFEWKRGFQRKEGSVIELEETSKILANCNYEKGTQWGNEMGLRYGCPVEDVITGLSIQCRGWKSVYFNPKQKAFLGVPPITLAHSLVQHKRWSEGNFQMLLSKYGPLTIGFGRIKLGLQLGYCVYCLWASSCLPTLCFLIVPPLCLLKGISLFPKVSSVWFLPFAYVIITVNLYSLGEFLWSGGTILGWWNEQRMWIFKREASYFFGFIDTILKLISFSKSAFDINC